LGLTGATTAMPALSLAAMRVLGGFGHRRFGLVSFGFVDFRFFGFSLALWVQTMV
jgi:hypothetical protein